MVTKDKKRPKPRRNFIKQDCSWVEVDEELYRDHTRFIEAYRKRHQYHGQCVCPKSKFWLCDADYLTCEFCRAGNTLSLDYETENDEGGVNTLVDQLSEYEVSVEDLVCDQEGLLSLFKRLEELMPEALTIGRLREAGLSDEAIAAKIGVKRTTFRSSLSKEKEALSAEFADWF